MTSKPESFSSGAYQKLSWLWLGLSSCAAVVGLACESSIPEPQPSQSARAKPTTPDRLAPGELAEGNTELFGLKLPKGMKLEARFPTSAHATGTIPAAQLSNYVRKRVAVRHVELAASRTVFEKARIKGAPSNHLYRIEVVPTGRRTKLAVHLLNPPKPPAVEGLSEAERWKRAGLTPDGKMIDPQSLE